MDDKFLTSDMVDAINMHLEGLRCGFHYEFEDDGTTPCMRMYVNGPKDIVESAIINCTDSFYDMLDRYFEVNFGVILSYNNTRSTCWVHC